MILAVEMDISTGTRYDEQILCEDCFDSIDHTYACNCPERVLCKVQSGVTGECVACKEREHTEQTDTMTFEVEVHGLNHHQEDLLIDRLTETIKDFGVDTENFRIFLDD